MILYLAIFSICTVILGVVLISLRGVRRKASQLLRPMSDLLKRGFNGATLVIEHSNSNYFVQFSKYIISKGDYGISFDFPRSSWSEGYYQSIKKLCDSENIHHDIQEVSSDGEVEFLVVDFRKDVDAAFGFVVKVLSEVFECKDEDLFKVTLNNAHVDDVLVDSNKK